MEHIVGKTLYDFQEETGTQVPPQIVIKALMKLKACGVRHNDLHGANLIVMTKRGRIAGVKLIDFGEASETRAIHPKQYKPTLNSNYRNFF
jgi:predicted Ser/Thr protein kinase